MLELINISKSYEFPGRPEGFSVLKDISLKIKQGDSASIVGPSGSGKSTLLNIIGALDHPTSGQVLLNGRDLTTLPEKRLAKIRNQQIGFVFQQHHLLPQCTALENVLVPTLAPGNATEKKQNALRRALDLLKQVGLEQHIHHRPGELSGGQRQRVAVVRALINQPSILLADEPTGSLDKAAGEKIIDLLIELNRTRNVTLIVVSHDITLARRAGQVLELQNGQLKNGSRQ